MKKLFIVAAILAALLVGPAAQAAPETATMTLAEWAAAPTKQVDDMIFTYIGSDLPAATIINFNGPGTLGYSLNLSGSLFNSKYIVFTAAIDQAMSPDNCFSTITISQRSNATIKGTVSEANLELWSMNGSSSGAVGIPGSLESLTVRNDFTSSGSVASANYFNVTTATPVPEPGTMVATLAMFGSAGLGLIFRRRRV